jgi:hypothetical protein
VVCGHIERCSIKFEAGAVYIIPTSRRNTMAKRIILALLVVTLAAGGAFAQELSAGVGGNFAISWEQITMSAGGNTGEVLGTTSGAGFYAFFDATYVEVDVGMLFGSQKVKQTMGGSSSEADGPDVSVLTLGLYGKYPIDLGGFILFPLLGIQYDLGLSAKQTIGGTTYEAKDEDLPDALNRLWVKLGVGADINLSDALYLRPSILYGINFGSKNTNDAVDGYKNQSGVDVTSFYHGLDIRVALGFKL